MTLLLVDFGFQLTQFGEESMVPVRFLFEFVALRAWISSEVFTPVENIVWCDVKLLKFDRRQVHSGARLDIPRQDQVVFLKGSFDVFLGKFLASILNPVSDNSGCDKKSGLIES